jgi:hypothetical protein
MTAEVDWVLDQFGSVVGSTTVPLQRIDRDDSRILEQDVRSLDAELTDANYVGVRHEDTTTSPIGTEYDLEREAVVSVRVTGLHASKYGWIDPDGDDGIPFGGADGLVQQLQDALWSERQFPDAGIQRVDYTHLELQNEANTSRQYGDFYRADWDVVFQGFEELP